MQSLKVSRKRLLISALSMDNSLPFLQNGSNRLPISPYFNLCQTASAFLMFKLSLCTVAHKQKKSAKPVKVRVFPGSFGFHGSLTRTAKANEELLRRWEFVQTFHGMDNQESIRKAWGAYQRAVVKLVREDKRALYSSPHVRRCIEHAILAGDKDFFVNLGDVLPTGIGLDKRIEKQLPLARHAERLHRQGNTWSQVADILDPDAKTDLDGETLRVLVRGYRKQGLLSNRT
jgi:hypothetical protein